MARTIESSLKRLLVHSLKRLKIIPIYLSKCEIILDPDYERPWLSTTEWHTRCAHHIVFKSNQLILESQYTPDPRESCFGKNYVSFDDFFDRHLKERFFMHVGPIIFQSAEVWTPTLKMSKLAQSGGNVEEIAALLQSVQDARTKHEKVAEELFFNILSDIKSRARYRLVKCFIEAEVDKLTKRSKH